MNIRDFFHNIISVFYPNRCPFCSQVISTQSKICSECSKKIKTTIQKFTIHIDEDKYTIAFSPFKYEGDIRNAIFKFKFHNYREFSNYFAEQIILAMKQTLEVSNFDIVTCVPMSKNKRSSRGYNQAQDLAKDIASKINVSYSDLLKKVKDNLEQHNLNAEQRLKNVYGVYEPVRPDKNIRGKNILLCDDIITTGNTVKECCRILYKYGASSITCVSIARALGRRN